ncbi:MAG: sigma-54 dependent transcriptional regulator [Candidatus Eisenbacteria bacterium]
MAAARNRTNLAIVLLKSGGIEEAAIEVSKAVASLQGCPTPLWRILAEMVQAKCHRLLGRHQEARELLHRLLTEIRFGVHKREEAICLEYLGDCFVNSGLWTDALDSYRAAERIAAAHAPNGDIIPELGHRIGECLVHLGDPNAAILACEHGLKVALETGDRYEECATQRVLAMAHRAAGNATKAYRLADHGIALGRAYEIPYELARTLAWAGSTRLESQQRDEQMIGRLQLWEARANFERIGLEHEAVAIDRLLGFEESPDREESTRPDLAVLEGIEGLDRGALRFGIVTTSPAISAAVATLQSVAPSKIPVLISGPSGTGKELLAQALHLMSDRRKRRLVPVNCAALSPGILDSELFGHERGAFTGAVAARDGLFAAADGGTLLLDEVGELSPTAQATLLRILETGELRRVGTDEVHTIDVRVVAATNADLGGMVERGTFRRDLYYRLAGVRVAVPALAEREEDILPLFRYFLAQVCAAAGKRLSMAADVEPLLRAYAWPGNVRELRNEVARLVAVSESGSVIGLDALLPELRVKLPATLRRDRVRAAQVRDERAWILEALRAHRGNKTDAARSLEGMNRTTLLYKMERLGIRPEEYSTEDA